MSAKKPKHPYRDLFSTLKHLPFLFIGSGISRRYMGLPNWEELLRIFALKVLPGNSLALEVFSTKAGVGGLPEVASLIEAEFNQIWLTAPEYQDQRKLHQDAAKARISPFKIELAEFFRAAEKTTDPHLLDELSCLSNVAKRSVAGVITTNYDLLPEEVFKGYDPFIGQEQLLFGGTQGVSEIYKIHGCCTQAESLVISAADYHDFDRRNAYLAAKLLTVFVDHPIIFLGYSLSDPNVQGILKAIIDCLSTKNLKVLKQRLIFVEYNPDPSHETEISEHSLNFSGGSRSVSMTKITLNDFLPLYSELLSQKYQYNPKLLRQLKRDIYKLVTTNEPVDRFQITDIEDDDALENVGVLAGVGVIQLLPGGERGHHIPDSAELFCDVVFDDRDFDLKSLVEDALPKLQKSNSHTLPVHKYVKEYREQFGLEPPADLLNVCKNSVEEMLNVTLRKARKEHPVASLDDLRELAPTDEKWFEMLPRVTNLDDAAEEIRDFLATYLTAHPDALQSGKATDKTNIKRVIRIYDWLKYC